MQCLSILLHTLLYRYILYVSLYKVKLSLAYTIRNPAYGLDKIYIYNLANF